MTIEELAKILHEAGREAVQKNCLVNPSSKGFIEWGDLNDQAKEGRRIQARYLLERYNLIKK
jgi:hypothetical protein